MKRKLISTLMLATAVAMPLGAMAANAPAARNPVDRTADTGAGTFKSFDTNKDGFISRNEAKNSTELNRQFNSLDKDGDGKLSPQELSGWNGGSLGSMASDTGSSTLSRGSTAPVGPGGQPKSGF